MAGSDLTKPLGLDEPKPRRPVFYIAAGVVAVVMVAGVVWHLASSTRGPTATAVIATPPAKVAALPPPDVTSSTNLPKAALTDVTPSGSLTGVGNDDVVIHNPSDPQPVALAVLPEQDLVEASTYGPLPRISATGKRPLDAYARPSQADPEDVRIAIVVGGLGIDPGGTRNAIATLPGEVTLAFAPYDQKMAADVAAARTAGHELLLQVPLEPYNYPATDPGPNTLTADATDAENQGRLRWFLGRMTSYVGVVNYLGARFTADQDAMAPVMREIASRGLLYLDDGSSARSTAAAVGGSAPFLRADLVLDADLDAAAIDDRLSQLQAIARQRGYAIATATAFPVTVDRIAAFAKAAAAKGIAIVPVSALVSAHS